MTRGENAFTIAMDLRMGGDRGWEKGERGERVEQEGKWSNDSASLHVERTLESSSIHKFFSYIYIYIIYVYVYNISLRCSSYDEERTTTCFVSSVRQEFR